MTDLLSTLIIVEEVRSCLAVLGLLLCWKLHAIELRHRGAVTTQLFLCLSENDPETCAQCRMAHLCVYSGRMAREVGLRIHCSNRLGCRCALIPITRQWPVAKRLRKQMKRGEGGSLHLSDEDLQALLHEVGNLSNHDRLAQSLLRAMLAEDKNPEEALQTYRRIIAQAPETSIALQQAAAYMRTARILERSGDVGQALQVTRACVKVFSEKERYILLTKPQYNGMLARQSRLIRGGPQ
jgi:tetratricopeptide (TPR) repeat protein